MKGRFLLLLSFVAPLGGCAMKDSSSLSPADYVLDMQIEDSSRMDPELERSSAQVYHYLVGRIALTNEDFETARENFQAASELLEEPVPHLHATLAELYVRSGELEKAKVELERALEQKPDEQEFLLLYAGVLESVEQGEEAIPVYRELMKRDPLVPDAYLLLAGLYGGREDYEQGAVVLEQLLKRQPDNTVAQLYLGRFREAQGQLQEAESHLAKAFESQPMNEGIVKELLRVVLKQEKFSRAKEICNTLLDIDPGHILARRILGELAIGERKLDEAIEHLRIVGERDGEGAALRYRIALLELEKQNYRAAERELNFVIAQDSNHSEARYYLASIYAGSGRKKEALQLLGEIQPDQTMYLKSRNFRAFLLRQEERFAEAAESVREVLQVEPNNRSALSYLVLLLRDSQQYQEAISVLDDAIRFYPEDDRFTFQYGVVLHELGEEEESLEQMERVIQLNPDHTDALNFVAYTLAEQGKGLERAEVLVRRALEIRAYDGYYLDTLGWILFKKGDLQEARITLERAAALTDDDLVIMGHLGDVLRALEMDLEAIAVYRRAIEKVREVKEPSPDQIRALEHMREQLKELEQENPDAVVQSRE